MKKMFFSLVNSIFGLGLMVAGVVSGIWLIVVGDWWRLVFGVGFMFLSSLIIMIVPMPALIFSIPAIKYLDQGKKFLGMFFLSLSNIVLALSISALSILVLWFMVKNVSENLIPILMWSYVVAMTPWASAVGKEQERGDTASSSLIATYFQMLAYIVGAIIFYFRHSILEVVYIFAVVMLISVIKIGRASCRERV